MSLPPTLNTFYPLPQSLPIAGGPECHFPSWAHIASSGALGAHGNFHSENQQPPPYSQFIDMEIMQAPPQGTSDGYEEEDEEKDEEEYEEEANTDDADEEDNPDPQNTPKPKPPQQPSQLLRATIRAIKTSTCLLFLSVIAPAVWLSSPESSRSRTGHVLGIASLAFLAIASVCLLEQHMNRWLRAFVKAVRALS